LVLSPSWEDFVFADELVETFKEPRFPDFVTSRCAEELTRAFVEFGSLVSVAFRCVEELGRTFEEFRFPVLAVLR
jgi:hypothetical protein